jgi:hypothetical protein
MAKSIIQEEWKDVKSYEGLYQISNLGNVCSLTRSVRQGKYGHTRVVENRILSPTNNGHGYLIVGLRKDGQRKNYYIHRLVAEHFVENVYNKKYVNHKDYNTTNNTADNLEWCTQRENINYSRERMKKPRMVTKSKTGYKYIYLRNGMYRVCVPHLPERYFDTIEKALEFRGW